MTRTYTPSRGPRTRPGRPFRPRPLPPPESLVTLTYFFCQCRAAMGSRDHGGIPGETEDQIAARLAPLAVQALDEAGERVGCAMARMPGELFYPEINGYTAIRRMRHRKAKALRFKPLMPGYFVAGFTTPTPDWTTIADLAGGMHIYGAVQWFTERHPEGEPHPMTLVHLRACEAQMRGEVGLIEHVAAAKPEHQAHQRTGAEFDVGDIVAVRYGNFAGFEGPVTRMRDASAWVEISIFGRMSEVEIPQIDLAPVKLQARAA